MSTQSKFPLFRLLVLTGAIFVAVSSEFLPTGLLPDMASDLRVSESQVGLLITIFALTVVASAAPLAVLTRRFPRKGLMVVMLGVFAITNVLVAVAPTYELLVVARILGGLAHGVFWSVAGPYASRLVPRRQLVRALAVTGAGGTIAFILGIPLGAALGHAFGWRMAFVAMAVVVMLFAIVVVVFLPPVQHLHTLTTGEISLPFHRDRTIPAVVAACVLTMIIVLGQNIFGTYIAPWFIVVGGFPADSVAVLLFVMGVAGAIGLTIAGLAGDRYPRATFSAMLATVGVSVALLGLFGGTQWAAVALILLWGASFGGLPSLLHGRVLGSASPRIRDLASASLTTAFNISIGVGALVGGLLFDSLGVRSLPWAYLVLIVVGLVVAIVADLRHPHRHAVEDSAAIR